MSVVLAKILTNIVIRLRGGSILFLKVWYMDQTTSNRITRALLKKQLPGMHFRETKSEIEVMARNLSFYFFIL